MSHISRRSLDIVNRDRIRWFPLFVVCSALILGTLAVVAPPYISVGILVLTTVAVLTLLNFEIALLLILAVRPVLDLDFIQNRAMSLPGLPLEMNAARVLNLLIVFVGLLYILAHKINVFKSPVSRAALTFILVCIFTVALSPDRALTLATIIKFISYFVIYVVFATTIKDRKQVDRLLAVIVFAALAPSAIAIFQIFTAVSTFKATGVPRVNGVFDANVILGEFLVVPLSILLVLFLQAKSRAKRIAYSPLVLSYAVAFFFSLARAAWGGLVLVILTLGFFRNKKLLVLMFLALVILWAAVPAIALRFSDLQDPSGNSLVWRLKLWKAAIDVFKSSPIMGIGFGIADEQVGVMATGKRHPIHNDYLRVLADTGLVGLSVFMWLLFSFLESALSTYRKVTVPFFRTLTIGFFGVCLAFMWARSLGNYATHTVIQYYFWAFAALVYALPRVESLEGRTT